MLSVKVPGDKSISHRALILAPLAAGKSRLSGLATGADVEATAAAMRALGVDAALQPGDGGLLELDGPLTLRSPDGVIECGNSGTTARLLLGLVAGQPVTATLDGDGSLRRRPMDRIVGPLSSAGASVRELGQPGRLPLEMTGGSLRPIDHHSAVASAQVKSALLLAGLGADVPVTVVQPGPSRDHTERMLRAMGVEVTAETEAGGERVKLEPPGEALLPLDLNVPGDFSSAAFWIALAVLGGAGDGVRVEGVGLNPGRTGFLRALELMGADVEAKITGEEAGEPVGDIEARPAPVSGAQIPAEWVPSLLDEVPMLVCVAAMAGGTTTVTGAAELRVKESDRLAVLQQNLEELGARCLELPDGLVVEGGDVRLAGRAVTRGDHRIAMAFGVLGALPGNAIEIDELDCVAVSYPDFWEELERLRAAARAS
jgi:3-phosphoshikimate 1-carboxyvinyltransferase